MGALSPLSLRPYGEGQRLPQADPEVPPNWRAADCNVPNQEQPEITATMQGTNEPATWRGPKNSPRGGNWKQLSHQTAHPKPHPWPVFLQGRKQGERRENLTVLLAKKPQKPTLNLHTILRHGWEAGLSTVEDNSILVGSLNSWYLSKIQSHKRLCYTRSQASYFFFLPPVPWADMGAFLCMMRPRGKS